MTPGGERAQRVTDVGIHLLLAVQRLSFLARLRSERARRGTVTMALAEAPALKGTGAGDNEGGDERLEFSFAGRHLGCVHGALAHARCGCGLALLLARSLRRA